MNIRVLGNRVLVKRLEAPKMKSAIIEVVEMNPDPSQYAKVLAIGEMVNFIKVGDVVVLGQYSGARIEIEREEAYFVSVDDVLGVVET